MIYLNYLNIRTNFESIFVTVEIEYLKITRELYYDIKIKKVI